MTYQVLMPTCPSWCEGKHPTFLALDESVTDSAEVIDHTRHLCDLAQGIRLDLVCSEPHPDGAAAGRLDGARIDGRTEFCLYIGNDQAAIPPDPEHLRSLAGALLDAAAAAEGLLR